MSDKKLSRAGLLRSLLVVLVDEWGYVAVRERLDEIGALQDPQLGASRSRGLSGEAARGRAKEKPTASAIAEKVSLPHGQKQLILQLAAKYDNREFLPTLGDIRYFFEVHGEIGQPGKQRSESFRKVLRLLCALPESGLRQMIDSDAHSGPSRLAPLSDAMRGVGEKRSPDRGVGDDGDLARRSPGEGPSDA